MSTGKPNGGILTATPYHNVRIEEKEDHDILVVGGEEHNSGMKFEDYHDAYSNLEKWANTRRTSAGDVLYKWTGQVIVKVYKSVNHKQMLSCKSRDLSS